MRRSATDMVRAALHAAVKDGVLTADALPEIIIEKPKKEEFGDFSTNIAMLLAPAEKKAPREIASLIAGRIKTLPEVERCEVAGPGFINMFLKRSYWTEVLEEIIRKGDGFGKSETGKDKTVQIEFVSANPTGPLHIGHGRGAAVGDSLSRILKAAGFKVVREYYINDAGRQVKTLGESVRLRMEELRGKEITIPENFYKGAYVKDIAREYLEKFPDGQGPDIQDYACSSMLSTIRKDLDDFGVAFDEWFSERSLDDTGLVASTIDELKGLGHVYESEGALWFRTTAFGDDKDRVLIKADGERTYFASDIAYHREKIKKGFSTLVNIWGADHHGYEGRIRAILKAFGHDDAVLKIIFIQLVALLRKGVPVAMGKREGEFVTLRQVMDEVGTDACRFFFLMRRADAHLDFDLELAKSQAPENPVYYVQYTHARIYSIIGFAREKGLTLKEHFDSNLLAKLDQKEEIAIIKHLSAFEETIEKSALHMEPHKITFYLMELAGLFHPYYNKTRVVTDDPVLTDARLLFCKAVGTVVANGLGLLGVSAPVKM
ncbi:MAG: arginine--tRNA ligase [Deltaproteobacteria bacterium GWC2_56_8]|nr:MAG: arginine--tRNA ligase [Deltaproteobacteria bacterium GWB2_55_19]OGP37131.1 MAG: arginine--tRNA ligase [Deltaproteobacteria bacterium GWC2_56_8]